MSRLPELSRFELECLRRLWSRGTASVRQIQEDLPDTPSYSTVRKIVERLEAKGAIERVHLEGKAWIYRSLVPAPAVIRRELGRVLDLLFDGASEPLVSHLVDMDAITIDDLRAAEERIERKRGKSR